MKRHSDYISYLTKLKYDKYNCTKTFLGNTTNNIIIEGTNETIPTQNIFNSPMANFSLINTNTPVTYIVEPIDVSNLSNFKNIYLLNSDNSLTDGFIKTIINTCEISSDKTIQVYSSNSNGVGGFNNIGQNFNCYSFVCKGDKLILSWSEYNDYWCIQNYDGVFSNINL